MSAYRRRAYWDELLTLWLGFGFIFCPLLGALLTTLLWAAGNPLWWIVAIVEGVAITVGLIVPWTESR